MRKNMFLKTLRRYDWLFLVFFWLLFFVFGFSGWQLFDTGLTKADCLYLTFQLITLESGSIRGDIPIILQIARFGLPLLTVYTAILVFLRTFKERMQWLSLLWINDHVIIGRLGRRGLFLTREFRKMGRKVVVIEEDAQNDRIPVAQEMGAIVVTGSPADLATLRLARIEKASALIGVDEDDNDNLEMGMQVKKFFQDQPAFLSQREEFHCVIHLGDYKFCELVSRNVLNVDLLDSFHFKSFNIFQQGAFLMWKKYGGLALQSESGRAPHILQIGLGRFGQNLLLEMARDWAHTHPEAQEKLEVTLIATDVEWRFADMLQMHPFISEVCNCHLNQMNVHSKAFYSLGFVDETKPFNAVYVCLDNDYLGLEVGLFLARALVKGRPPVTIRMLEKTNLAAILEENDESDISEVNLFGVLDEVCTPEIFMKE